MSPEFGIIRLDNENIKLENEELSVCILMKIIYY